MLTEGAQGRELGAGRLRPSVSPPTASIHLPRWVGEERLRQTSNLTPWASGRVLP